MDVLIPSYFIAAGVTLSRVDWVISAVIYNYWVVAVSRAALSEVVPFSCAHAGPVSAHDM